jgi:hypothetical protein
LQVWTNVYLKHVQHQFNIQLNTKCGHFVTLVNIVTNNYMHNNVWVCCIDIYKHRIIVVAYVSYVHVYLHYYKQSNHHLGENSTHATFVDNIIFAFL